MLSLFKIIAKKQATVETPNPTPIRTITSIKDRTALTSTKDRTILIKDSFPITMYLVVSRAVNLTKAIPSNHRTVALIHSQLKKMTQKCFSQEATLDVTVVPILI